MKILRMKYLYWIRTNVPNVVRHFGSTNSEYKIFQFLGKDRTKSFILSDENVKVEEVSFFDKKKLNDTLFDMSRYFLPKGYPESVGNGYFNYVSGQSLNLFLSSAGSVLSMQSLLYAIGLGAGSIPLAATLNWIIKDGMGQLGGVIFAGMVNNKFDSDPKRWRMISSISMECSSFIEILTPLAPGYFLILASVANIGKNIAYLSASASRAAIHKSFAIHENLADVVAKSGSQSIFASMTGTAFGALIAASAQNSYEYTLASFVALSLVSQFVGYKSLEGVKLNTLSLSRFHYLFHLFERDGKVLDPEEFLSHEHLLGAPSMYHNVPIHVGVNLNDAVKSKKEFEFIQELFKKEKFVVTLRSTHVTGSVSSSAREKALMGEICILMKTNAEVGDILKGLAVANICRVILARGNTAEEGSGSGSGSGESMGSQLKIDTAVELLTSAWLRRRLGNENDMVFRDDVLKEAYDDMYKVNTKYGKSTALEFINQCSEKWISDMILLETRYASKTKTSWSSAPPRLLQ